MSTSDAAFDVRSVAHEALSVLGQGRLIAPFSSRHVAFGLDNASGIPLDEISIRFG